MRSKFALGGHPIHPMLVAIPIGLFAWALVADIVYLARDHDRLWYDISFWSGIAAVISALIAALPGFGDYFTMAVKSEAAAVATSHMVLNLTVVALFSIAAVLMRSAGATEGDRLTAVVVLHFMGVGLLLLSGWLGGEMVFRHHLAMVPDGDTEQQEEAHHMRHGTTRLGPR
jgi:uncharacterized membrane protein